MFRRAAEILVKTCGEETLHPVADLNSSEHFKPLCIVEKKKSYWPLRQSTFIPTCMKITDLLDTDIPKDIQVTTKKVALLESFKDIPTFDINGSVITRASQELEFDAKEDEKVKLVMKLGDLEKEEVSWQEINSLLKSSSFKYDDHLYKSAKQAGRTLCIVIESIRTKEKSSVSENLTITESADIEAGATKFIPTVIVPEIHSKGEIERKEDESFVLPPGTILAFGCVEFCLGADGFAKLHSTYDQYNHCSGEMTAKTSAKMKKFELMQPAQLNHSITRNALESAFSVTAYGARSFVCAAMIYTSNVFSSLANQKDRSNVITSDEGFIDSLTKLLFHQSPENASPYTFAEQSFEEGYLLFH